MPYLVVSLAVAALVGAASFAVLHTEGALAATNPTIFAVRTDADEVALTFDDGPSPRYTPEVLQLLSRYGVHATFFVLGEEAKAYPNLVKAIVAQGSEVESHGFTHRNLAAMSPASVARQLTSAATVIRSILGRNPILFRPPYGSLPAKARAVVTGFGETPILWDIDPRDWAQPGTDSIVSAVLGHVQRGDIILFHDAGGNRSQTIAALKIILPALAQRGLKPVILRTLISSGIPIHHYVEH